MGVLHVIEVAAFTLICGTFIGMVLGVFLMCVMSVASDADDRQEEQRDVE